MSAESPAPRPCTSCPYRCDVPSGIWAASEYAKLLTYDQPTFDQPGGLFLCHQNPAGSEHDRLCAGWVACHGDQLLGLRMAISMGHLEESVLDYVTDVAVFASAAEAVAHGCRDIERPSAEASEAVRKIAARRPDVELG